MSRIILYILIVSFISVSCNDGKNEKDIITVLENEVFQNRIEQEENLQLVDVRTAEEVAQSSIPGAVNICFTCDGFEDDISELSKEEQVYVYCRVGGRSARASAVMKKLGFKRIYDLKGGITEWEADGFPVVK